MAKAAQHSIGKLFNHTRLDDALVETGAFNIKVIESVISGSHYDWSLRDILKAQQRSRRKSERSVNSDC